MTANRYIEFSHFFEMMLTFQRSVDSALIFGLEAAICFLPAAAVAVLMEKRMSRAVVVLFMSTIAMFVLFVIFYFVVYFFSGKGELPFFCQDADCVRAFLSRALITKLEPSFFIPLFIIFGIGLTVFSFAVSLCARQKELSEIWARVVFSGYKRRVCIWFVILVSVFVLHMGSFVLSPRLSKNMPNILLVSIDTLRADSLGCYGAPIKTPNIDRVAQQGVRFTQAYTTSPWTLPAHGSLMTSRSPDKVGLRLVEDRLSEKWMTLSEVLEQTGYRTGAVVNHLFVSKAYGFGQGFSFFKFFEKAGESKNAAALSLRFIEQSKEPWFCFLHFFDPHWPFADIDQKTLARFTGADHTTLTEKKEQYLFFKAVMNASDDAVVQLKMAYWKEVESVDRQLGAIFSRLESLGKMKNTIIVITADHGEGFGEHGLFGHGYFLNEEVLKIPLIIYYPEAVAKSMVWDQRVDIRDIAPTVLAMTKIPPSGQFEGRNLIDGFIKDTQKKSPLVVRSYLSGLPSVAVIFGRAKYISPVSVRFKDLQIDKGPALYLLNEDEKEIENKAGQMPELLLKLRGIATLGKVQSEGKKTKTALTQSEKDGLESLGYLP